jgi:hypothetical protein
MTNHYAKYVDFVIHNFKKMSETQTIIQGPCDLDLCHSDPKINRGQLLVMANQYVKYEDFINNF